jgi:hypothetical protein
VASSCWSGSLFAFVHWPCFEKIVSIKQIYLYKFEKKIKKKTTFWKKTIFFFFERLKKTIFFFLKKKQIKIQVVAQSENYIKKNLKKNIY